MATVVPMPTRDADTSAGAILLFTTTQYYLSTTYILYTTLI